MVTIQEVASKDGRFVLNFSAEGDRRFVLKAQPWHFKRDGVIFAVYDATGNPEDVDLGVMSIWAQVRGLPFELKTEAMGWQFGDQLGEVSAVSHCNKVIEDKFLRVRVEILLHEPIKSTVSFTPLGSQKEEEFEVNYEKLSQYCVCCGLVGHVSERFCGIPKDKRKAIYPNNLRVDAYWKEHGSTQRALNFGGLPRCDELPIIGTGRAGPSKALEGMVVEVASAVDGLEVSAKNASAAAGNPPGSLLRGP